MFTGIIEGTGTIIAIRRRDADYTLSVDTGQVVQNPVTGESVALDGVCLTVVASDRNILSFDISPETIAKTTFKYARAGDSLNIERAMRLRDRLGGHLVQGHVDCVGKIARVDKSGEGFEIEVELDSAGSRYVVPKGSIAVSGISLTVAAKKERSITIAVIPHTWQVTTLAKKTVGSTVNIEYDIIGKYVENLVNPFNTSGGGTIDREFLSKNGY